MKTPPLRLPGATSIEAAPAQLDPASAEADLVPALAAAFRGFEFDLAKVDDDDWRGTRALIRSDGTRIGALRPWMMVEPAKDGGDIKTTWMRLNGTNLRITEWRGNSALVFIPIYGF